MAPTPKKKIVASTPNKDEIALVTSTPNKKIMTQKGILGFMKNRAPPVLSIKDLHHGAAKYSLVRGLNDSGTVLSLPIEQQQKLLELSELRTAAINEKDWQRGELIQRDMDNLKEWIAGMNSNIEDAKGALKESLLARKFYIDEGITRPSEMESTGWVIRGAIAEPSRGKTFQHLKPKKRKI
jgi:hypothetical protein